MLTIPLAKPRDAKSGIVGRSPRGWSAVRQICVPGGASAAELVLLWLSGLVFGQRGVGISRRHPALAQILARSRCRAPWRAACATIHIWAKRASDCQPRAASSSSTVSSAAWSMSASRPASCAPARRGCIHGAPANPPPCAATRQRPHHGLPSRKHSRAGRCQPAMPVQRLGAAHKTLPGVVTRPCRTCCTVCGRAPSQGRCAGFCERRLRRSQTQQGNVGQARNTTKRVLVNHLQQTAVVQLAVFGQGGFLALFCAGFELRQAIHAHCVAHLVFDFVRQAGLSFRYSRTLSLPWPIFWPLCCTRRRIFR